MPIWHLMSKELISGWTEKRKNPFFELSVGRYSISMWDHQINPDGDTILSISVTKTIYFDGLTMNKFFGFISLLKRAFALLELTYCDHVRFSSSHISSQGRINCQDNHAKVTWAIPLPNLGNWGHFADGNVPDCLLKYIYTSILSSAV